MTMTIGELARRSGVSVETIRFYERKGLLTPAARRPSGYRVYTDEAGRRIQFIRRAKDLGFSLSEVGELLALRTTPDSTCADVRDRVAAKVETIDRKLNDLHRIRGALQSLSAACMDDEPIDDCPVLAALDPEEPPCPPSS